MARISPTRIQVATSVSGGPFTMSKVTSSGGKPCAQVSAPRFYRNLRRNDQEDNNPLSDQIIIVHVAHQLSRILDIQFFEDIASMFAHRLLANG